MILGQTPTLRWTAPEGAWTKPDLHLFPQDGHRYEIVDGSLHVTPPLDARHQAAVRALVTSLRSAAPTGWWVCDRLGIEFGGNNLVPDITVLRPHSSGATWAAPEDVALVVEVEAPESQRYDRLLKPSLYADAGIAAYWRIDLLAHAVHVYELVDGDYTHERTLLQHELVRLSRPYPVRLAPSMLA